MLQVPENLLQGSQIYYKQKCKNQSNEVWNYNKLHFDVMKKMVIPVIMQQEEDHVMWTSKVLQ